MPTPMVQLNMQSAKVQVVFTHDTTYFLSMPFGNRSSNYRAELQAINAAIQHLVQRGTIGKIIAVLTASLSADVIF